MIKYLAGKYYYLLLGCLLFFAINHLIVDTLLDWIYNKPPLGSFLPNPNYDKELLVRTIISLTFAIYIVIVFFLSLFFIFRKEASHVNRVILITVSLLIGFLILIFILHGLLI